MAINITLLKDGKAEMARKFEMIAAELRQQVKGKGKIKIRKKAKIPPKGVEN